MYRYLSTFLFLFQSIQSAVTVPIEVIGEAGITKSISLNIDNPSQAKGLWLYINNLSYENKASVQFNKGEWILLNNTNCIIPEPAKSYGGIGGAFHIGSIQVTLPIPVGALIAGSNTFSFKFNNTDGISAGFRIIKFNLTDATGKKLLSPSNFVDEDPNTWEPPLNTPADIAKGKTYWESKSLTASPIDPTVIKATCSACHTHDGMDLKYFNFSNNSIIERSKFHGLTQIQGEQIASYIRSLNVPNPGRPWNPPFQPGPTIDKKPINEWAAGAGLEWVLEKDEMAYPFIFPTGVNGNGPVHIDSSLNVKNIPVLMQFPDWNHWLPTIHPIDSWGDEFVNDDMNKDYNGEGNGKSLLNIRQKLSTGGKDYITGNFGNDLKSWKNDEYVFIRNRTEPNFAVHPPLVWTRRYIESAYSTALWFGVKEFEVIREFNADGYGKEIYGPLAEARTWPGNLRHVFEFSPHLLHFPSDDTLAFNNKFINRQYIANMWYHMQPVIASGYGRGGGFAVVDWGYAHGLLKDLLNESKKNNGEPSRMILLLAKQMQQTNSTGKGPESNPFFGWNFMRDDDVSRLVFPEWTPMWAGTDPDLKRQIEETLVKIWYDKNASYPISQFDRGTDSYQLLASSTIPIENLDGNHADKLYSMIPEFRKVGVDCNLLNKMADMGKAMWAGGNWDSKKAICTEIIYPQISITAPVNNTETLPGPLTFTVNASIPTGNIGKVEFYDGKNLIGSDNTAPYEFTFSNLDPGQHLLLAKAYDQNNKYATVDTRFVLVNEAGTLQTSIKDKISSAIDLQIYPNPARAFAHLTFINPQKQKVSIKVFNSEGKEMHTITDQILNVGQYKFSLSLENSGMYFVKIFAGNDQMMKRLIFVR